MQSAYVKGKQTSKNTAGLQKKFWKSKQFIFVLVSLPLLNISCILSICTQYTSVKYIKQHVLASYTTTTVPLGCYEVDKEYTF